MDFSEVLAEINGLITATWPEIPPMGSIPVQRYTSVQALRQSFVDGVVDGTLSLPCVVIKIGAENHDPEWGVRSRTYRVPLGIYYIAAEGTKQSTLHSKLSALRAAFEAADFAGTLDSFQTPPELGAIDTSDDSDVNARLVEEVSVRVASGSLMWNPGLLVH